MPSRELPIEPSFDGEHFISCNFRVTTIVGRDYDYHLLLSERPVASTIVGIITPYLSDGVAGNSIRRVYWQETHSYFIPCVGCHEFIETTASGITPCPNCIGRYTKCAWCSRWVETSDVSYDEQYNAICGQCREEAGICESCGCWRNLDELDDNNLCPDCRPQLLHDHEYCPDIHFLPSHQSDALYLGVELETDEYYDRGEQLGTAGELKTFSQDERLFHLKDDGSLNRGIEVVSQPAILDYHKNEFPWEKIIAVVKAHEGKSHDSQNCGLHIHFNSDFFGERFSSEHDLNVLKLISIFEKFWEELFVFSRRKSSELHWTMKYNGCSYWERIHHKEQLKKCCLPVVTANQTAINAIKFAKGGNMGRYFAVNVCNRATIELRIFKGTLIKETLFAAFEFADFLVRFVRKHSVHHIYKLTWQDLVKAILNHKEYEYLPDYLKERGLVKSV